MRYEVEVSLFRKDYVMRMIEEFVRVLAKIVLQRKANNYTDAKNELDGLSRLVTGFSLDHLRSLGPEGMNYVFSMKKETHAEQLYCSAKILKEEGMILEAQNRIDDSLECFFISKELFRMTSQMELDEKDEALKDYNELEIKLKNT